VIPSLAGTSATFTGATSTSFFATTASSTNLFASIAKLASATINSLTLTTPLAVSSGGTGTSTGGATNGIEYYNGSTLTNNANLTFNGTTFTAPVQDSGGQVFNIKAYGAKCDGITDDTAAIQAALNAAGAVRGEVLIPSSAHYCMFSNLYMFAYTSLVGQGILSSMLKQIPGSSGIGLQEQSVANGNTYGATGIVLRDFMLSGTGASDGTTDGINLGNNGYGYSSGGTIYDVMASGFANGDCFNLKSNAQAFYYLWADHCSIGLYVSGGGANSFYGTWAEFNTSYQVDIDEAWDNFYGVQIESNVNNTTALVYVTGAATSITGVYIGNAWASATKQFLIAEANGNTGLTVRDAVVENNGSPGPYTNTAGSVAYGTGTGKGNIQEYVYNSGVTAKKWYQNSGTGTITPAATSTLFTCTSCWATTLNAGAINATGAYTQTGTSADTFTGTPTFNNATYSALFMGGNVGIGTTSPFAQLSLAGSNGGTTNFFAISTSTSGYATTTALTIDQNGNLSLLNGAGLTLSSLATPTGSFLAVNTSGQVIATTTPTGSGGGASLSVANTWTALQTFQSALVSQASSTIGNGTQAGGLTISGGATTTGNAYFAGNVGIGTSNPTSQLTIIGSTPSTAVLGANGITDPTFTTMSYWNSPTNWASSASCGNQGASCALHTSGNTAALTLATSTITNNTYQLVFYASATGVTAAFGGYFSQALSAGTTTVSFQATTTETDTLTLTPTSAFAGFVTNATFQNIQGTTNPSVYFGLQNSNATAGIEIRSGGSSLYNTLIGYQSGIVNTTGSYNTSLGYLALNSNIAASNNTAVGYQSLYKNTYGAYNTASGYESLWANTTGGYNTANGSNSLQQNTSGTYNTASGYNSLEKNTTGSNNTASGYLSLLSNTTGSNNTASGYQSLYTATSTTGTVAFGHKAGFSMSGATGVVGNYNTLLGYQSGYDITTGGNNLILGTEQTTGTGITTGSGNILIGNGYAGLTNTGSNQLNIGNLIFGTSVGTGSTLGTGNVGIGTTSPFATLSVGLTATTPGFVVGVQGSTTPSLFVGSANQNGFVGIGTSTNIVATTSALIVGGSSIASGNTIAAFTNAGGTAYLSNLGLSVTSDIRLKKNIEPLAPVLAGVLELQPVTYNFTSEASDTQTHTGFIAQQVQPIFPDLISTDSQGMLSLNYAGLTPYLVSAVQEIASISGSFENALVAWLGNAANGITDLYATIFHGQELCLTSSGGTQTCINQQQLAAMVTASTGSGQAAANQSGTTVGGDTSQNGGVTSDASSTPPIIQINGDNPAMIQVGASYSDLGATITGPAADLNLGIQTFVGTTPMSQAVIDTSAPATYHIYYVVTDANGLTSTSTRTVVIQAADDNEEASSTDATSTTQ
jgi:hypothetical protein